MAAAFFAASGALHFVTSVFLIEGAPSFAAVWEALGNALLHLLVAAGLWRRLAVCRWVALVYCLAALFTYLTALGLAVAGQPLSYPPSVVVQSIFQIPSCALLLGYLRSEQGSGDFPRALLER